MTKHINFRASDIAPNPKEVFYWVDLQEDPTGGIIKYFDEELQYWTTLRILEGSIVKVEERLREWVTQKLQEQTEWVEDQVHQFDGRITVIEEDIVDLQESKQDKLTAGKGIAISEDNVISCIITLYEIVEELPTENIDPTHIYIVVNPKGTGSNLHDEYVYLNGEWELLGQDLAPYALRSQLDKEIQDRINADTALDNKLTAAINKEVQDRAAADTALGIRIDKEAAESEQRDIYLMDKLNEVENNLNNLHINDIPIEADTHIYGTDIQLEEIYPTSLEARTETGEIFSGDYITDAIYKLDHRVISNREQIQDLNNIIGVYENFDNTNYVSGSTSIVQAIKKLDAQLKPIVLPFALLTTTDSSYVASVFTDNFINELEEGLDKSRMVIFFSNYGKDSAIEETYRFTVGSINIDNTKNRDVYVITLSAIVQDALYRNSFRRIGSTWSIDSNPTHSGILTNIDIVNDLITNNSSKVLSAQQGKVLKDLIDSLTSSTNISKQELQELINTLNADLDAEILNRQNADSTLDNKINTEITNRQSADQTIQNTLTPIKTAYDKRGTKDGMLLLGDNGLIPAQNLPSYVDDVLDVYATYDKSETGELSNISLYTDSGKTTPVTPESGKIYIDVEGNYQFRWTGTQYATLGSPTVIGTASGTAFDGAEGNRIRTVVDSLPKTLLTGSIQRQLGDTTIYLKYDTVQYNNDNGEYTNYYRTVSLPIGSATSTYAGWMSARDKVKLDTNVVTLDEDQTITGKKTFKDYLLVETDDYSFRGIYTKIRSGDIWFVTNNKLYGRGLSWRRTTDSSLEASIGAYFDTEFKYYYFGDDGQFPIVKIDPEGNTTAKSFIKSGSSDQYVLLGGGGHKALNSFFTDLSSTTATNLSATVGGITKTITSLNARVLALTTTTDLNALKTDGLQVSYGGGGNSVLNKPTNTDGFGILSFRSATGWYTQILRSTNQNNGLFVRDLNASTWSNWDRILTESNYSSIADNRYVTINTAQNINGNKIMTGSLKIQSDLMFKYNSGTKGVYFTPRNDGGLRICSHEGYAPRYDIGLIDIDGNLTMNSFKKSGGTSTQFLKADGSVDSNTYLTTTGNAASAAKLQTARTLWGKTFDGTNNVSGNMSGLGVMTAAAGKYLDLVSDMGVAFYGNNEPKVVVKPTGYVGIGKTNPAFALDVNGAIRSNSYVYANGWFQNDTAAMGLYNSAGDARWYWSSEMGGWYADKAIRSNSTIQGTQLKSTVATGTAPLTVNSTTVVTNLNADLLDGSQLDYNGKGGVAYRKTFNTVYGHLYIKIGTLPLPSSVGTNSSYVDFEVTGLVDYGLNVGATMFVHASTRGSANVEYSTIGGGRNQPIAHYKTTSSNVEIWVSCNANYSGSASIEVKRSSNFTPVMTTQTTDPTGLVTGNIADANFGVSSLAGSPVRVTSADITPTGKNNVTKFLATSSMTTSKPPTDAHILHFNWDNTSGYCSQLAIQNTDTARLYTRGQAGLTWGSWKTVAFLDDIKWSNIADKPTIPSAYTLPTASATTLGGIKVGAGLTINSSGVLSATGGGTADSVDWSNVVGKPSELDNTDTLFTYRGQVDTSNRIPTTDDLKTCKHQGTYQTRFYTSTGSLAGTGHLVTTYATGSTSFLQLYSVYDSDHLMFRTSLDSSLDNREWKILLNNKNYATYVQKIGTASKGNASKPIYLNAGVPTVCGSSLAVSITGNAATATNANFCNKSLALAGYADTRNVVTKPSDYLAAFRPVGMKTGQTLGLNNNATDYYGVFGYRGYTDTTGDYAYEFALSKADKHILYRRGASDTWSGWNKLACMDDITSSSEVAIIDFADYLPDGPQAGTYTDGKGQALLRKVLEYRGSKFITFILHNDTVTAQMYLQYLVADTSYETNTMIIAFGNYLYTFTINGYNGTDYVVEETDLLSNAPDITLPETEVLIFDTYDLLSLKNDVNFSISDNQRLDKLFGGGYKKKAVYWVGVINDNKDLKSYKVTIPLNITCESMDSNRVAVTSSSVPVIMKIEWTYDRVNHCKKFSVYRDDVVHMSTDDYKMGAFEIPSNAISIDDTKNTIINLEASLNFPNQDIILKWIENRSTIALTLIAKYVGQPNEIFQNTVIIDLSAVEGSTNDGIIRANTTFARHSGGSTSSRVVCINFNVLMDRIEIIGMNNLSNNYQLYGAKIRLV